MEEYDDNEVAFTSGSALIGAKLRLLRLAKAVGAIWLYERYQRCRRGYVIRSWIDPFETPRLVWALSNRIARDDRALIELDLVEFQKWISPCIARLPGFDAGICFDQLLRELPANPSGANNYLRGQPLLCFIPSADQVNRRIVIHVVFRRGRPELTPGQHYRLMKRLRRTGRVNIEVIEELHADALRRNWRVPSIPRPFRIILPPNNS